MNDRVRITDVAPRDGLQSEPKRIPADAKVRLIDAIALAGVDEIEITSFVSPRWIPQLGDAAEVCAALGERKPTGVVFSALVPNERGMERLLEVNEGAGGGLIDRIAVFTAASETFSQRNTNASIAETLGRFRPVVGGATERGMGVRGYVSCAVKCPYEGDVEPARVADVAGRLVDLGVDEIDLGDTIGAGTPATITAAIEAVRAALPDHITLTVHLHDTFGKAGACVRAALDAGVRSFDAASAGLGGCPFASTPHCRAPGNISLCALVEAIEGAGLSTGVDHDAMRGAADMARDLLDAGAPS